MTAAAKDRKLRMIETILNTKSDKQLKKAEMVLNEVLSPAIPSSSLPPGAIEAVKRGLEDIAAGRLVSEEEFWQGFDEGVDEALAEIAKQGH